MDYISYFITQPQSYFMAMSNGDFAHGVDPDTVSSIEPLEAGFLTSPHDVFDCSSNLPITHGSPGPAIAMPMHVDGLDSGIGGHVEDSRASRTGSSSEEKEAAPTSAQSRRKAQNRAAQRAFRERKERDVRDLKAKLRALESSTHSLQTSNRCLELALQRAHTEIEILRASTAASPPPLPQVSSSYFSHGAHLPNEGTGDDPYNVQDLPNSCVVNSADKDHPASRRPNISLEIPAAQTWDFIQTRPLVKQGLVDIAEACEQLKGAARCDGNSPVYEGIIVWAAIESARRSGGDELI